MLTGIVRAEWIKIRSVRSTAWTLLLTLMISAGVGRLITSASTAEQVQDVDPLFATFYGLTLGQLALVVFGVLVCSGEHSAGTIRASLAAVPWRGRFYGGKVLAGGLVALATAVVTVTFTFVVVQPAFGAQRLSVGAGEVQQAMAGSVLYLTLICLFTMGIATMLRSTTAALAVLLPVFFLGSQGLGNVPGIVGTVAQYLPDQAGMIVINMTTRDDAQFARDYGPWTGLGILALWTAVALVGGWLLLRRRDV